MIIISSSENIREHQKTSVTSSWCLKITYCWEKKNVINIFLLFYFVFFFCFSFVYFRVFLSQQMEFLQPHLEAIIPQNKKAFLQQFYSQVLYCKMKRKRLKAYWLLFWNIFLHKCRQKGLYTDYCGIMFILMPLHVTFPVCLCISI